MNFGALSEPMPAEAVEWRVQAGGKKKNGGLWALVVPYADSRWLMSRLDEVCGPENWRDDYKAGPNGGVCCTIYIRVEGEWIGKQDVAENTDIEAVKGGVTDAFKRACVKWNVGNIRALYETGETWANISDRGRLEGALPRKAGGDRFRYDPPKIDLAKRAVSARPQVAQLDREQLLELFHAIDETVPTGKKADRFAFITETLRRKVTKDNVALLAEDEVGQVLKRVDAMTMEAAKSAREAAKEKAA